MYFCLILEAIKHLTLDTWHMLNFQIRISRTSSFWTESLIILNRRNVASFSSDYIVSIFPDGNPDWLIVLIIMTICRMSDRDLNYNIYSVRIIDSLADSSVRIWRLPWQPIATNQRSSSLRIRRRDVRWTFSRSSMNRSGSCTGTSTRGRKHTRKHSRTITPNTRHSQQPARHPGDRSSSFGTSLSSW